MPESPLASSSGRTGSIAGRYHKDVVDYEQVDVTRSPDGSMHKEKVHQKCVDKQGAVTAQTAPVQQQPAQQDNCHKKHDDCNNKGSDSSWGCMWIVWIILIFIIILVIVMGVLWAVKPGCVTRECEDSNDGCEVDFGKAALYAFVITFFLVLIGCLVWCCCR